MAAPRLLWMRADLSSGDRDAFRRTPDRRGMRDATWRNFAVDATNEQATRRDDTRVERIQRQR